MDQNINLSEQEPCQPILEESHQPILEESRQLILEESRQPILEESHQPILEELYNTKINKLYNIFSESLKLRLFLKENIDFVTRNNLIEILSGKISEDSESYKILYCFYNLINQKMNTIIHLKKWKDIYIYNIFWELSSTIEQINFLNNLRHIFLSIYDCSQGGSVYYFKLLSIFESNNYNYHQIMEDVEDRLKRTLNLFGPKIFEFLKIPLITVHNFYNLSNDQILKYISLIFKSIKNLLDEIIELFENFNLICSKLNILLNTT
jgi:hypothetical protein